MNSIRWYYNRIKSYIGRPRLVVQDRPVVLDDSDACPNPVFIVGAHRSGTSLVRRMFNAHPDIACPPESFFIKHYAAMFRDDLVRAGYDGFGYSPEQARMDLARKASSLHEALRIARGKQVWADKTPDYANCLGEIDELFAGSPRYVMVYRHPWDAVHSIWKRGWSLNEIADPFESALVHLRDTLRNMRDFESANPARCTRIVYRQLCGAPAETLAQAMAAIGLAFHPQMLEFGKTPHNFGLEDPVIRGKPDIGFSGGAWNSWSEERKSRARAILDPADYAEIC